MFSSTIRYPRPTNSNWHLVPTKVIKPYISLCLRNCIYKCFLQYFLKILRSGMHWHFMLVGYLWKNRNKIVVTKDICVAYLLFKLVDMSRGLESVNSTTMLVNYKNGTMTGKHANTVRLATFPKLRWDGWMEIELGNFNSKENSDGPIVEWLIESRLLDYKLSGLAIEGILILPKTIK